MKKFAVLILIVAAGIFAYTHFVDVDSASAEQQQLQALENQFQAARTEFTQASRTAGISGADMTGDLEAVIGKVDRIENDLKGLRSHLTATPDVERSDRLAAEIRDFKRRLGS